MSAGSNDLNRATSLWHVVQSNGNRFKMLLRVAEVSRPVWLSS
jgi:hypothetical protein